MTAPGLLLRFLVVGGLCALINLGLLYVAVEWFRWPYLWGLLLGFLVSNVIGFHLNRAMTFRGRGGHLARYLSVMSCSALLYMGGVSVLVDVAHMPYMAAAVLLTGLLAMLNFVAHRFWSFRH